MAGTGQVVDQESLSEVAETKKRSKSEVVHDSPTLATLLESLSSGVFSLIVAPKGLDHRVVELTIHDPVAPAKIEPGDLVLAIGTKAGSTKSITLVEEAGEGGAVAVAFKSDGTPSPELIQAAESSGVALLGVPAELEWSRLNHFLQTAITSSRLALDEHASSVPVGDLFALANALAATAGGAVVIADPQFRLLAYSSLDQPIDEARLQTIISRRPLASWVKRVQEDGTLRRLWQADDVVCVEGYTEEGLRRRLAIAVRAGEEAVGSIWITEGSVSLGAPAEKALREVASVAALHIIRHRAVEDLERHMRGQLVQSALEGRDPELLAKRLGINSGARLTVLAFEIQSTDEADIALRQEAVLDLITWHCEAFQRSVTASMGRLVYSVLQTPKGVNRDRLIELAEGVVSNARSRLRVSLQAGIGSTVPLNDIARSKKAADDVMRVLAVDSHERTVAHIEEVEAKVILLELTDLASDHQLEFSKLTALAEHDAQNQTPYLQTLRAYLDSFGDFPKAAATLNVYPNTLRYRLKRLAAISGMNLDDPYERLITDLALRQRARLSADLGLATREEN